MSAVLVVRPSSLGDVVWALAVAADIARARPGTAVDWVAEEAFVDLPALSPYVRRTIPLAFRRWRRALAQPGTWREAAHMRAALRSTRYDAIVDLQEQVKGGIVASLAHGRRHGYDRASIREPFATLLHDVHHAVPKDAHFLVRCRALTAAALGYAVEGPPRWSLRTAASVAAMPPGRFAVALHATSREEKLWPEVRWRALLAEFVAAGMSVLLPWGSESERARSNRIAAGLPGLVVPPRQRLADLASLLAHADLAVGVDTGLTHLAAVLGTPTAAIFTTTDPGNAGVAIAGAHAVDCGGNGEVPDLAAVRTVAGALLQAAPRC